MSCVGFSLVLSGRLHAMTASASSSGRNRNRRFISPSDLQISSRWSRHYYTETGMQFHLSAARKPRCNKLETVQREVRVHRFDELRLLTNERSLSAGSDHARIFTQFFLHTSNDAIHQCNITIEQAALHARYRGRTDQLCRFLNLDSRKLCGMFVQCLCRNHDAWCDDATTILARWCNSIKRRRCSEVHDDRGVPILVDDGNGIHNPVCTNFTRIVVEHPYAGVFMGDEHRLNGKVT